MEEKYVNIIRTIINLIFGTIYYCENILAALSTIQCYPSNNVHINLLEPIETPRSFTSDSFVITTFQQFPLFICALSAAQSIHRKKSIVAFITQRL